MQSKIIAAGLLAVGVILAPMSADAADPAPVAAPVAATASTASTGVNHLCKVSGKSTVYYKGACNTGDLALTFKGLRGATGATGPQGPQGIQGEVGPQGPQGVAGNDAGIVRKCATVTITPDFVSGTASERTFKISDLPPYTALNGSDSASTIAGFDLVASNLTAAKGALGAPGLKLVNATPALVDGSTTRSFRVDGGTGGGITAGESAPLTVCVARLSLA